MASTREKDAFTGTETTGHEWDGIKELDNPLPRWWLWTWYVSIVWSVGYWILMPAWPLVSGYTQGLLGYSQRAIVTENVAEAVALRAVAGAGLEDASLEEIRADPEMLEFALAGGRSSFLVNCSQCHGTGAAGSPGYPNLNDDDWLWGGTIDDIATTIRYGIRSAHDEARVNDMPAFLTDELLSSEEVADVTQYVLSLSAGAEDAEAATRGEETFVDWCEACHGEGGVGMTELGAPNLKDALWLYGGDTATITETISRSRGGVMPAWTDRLDALTIKQIAVYVHALGGGQ